MGIELRIRPSSGDWPPAVVPPETFLERLSQRTCFAKHPVVASGVAAGVYELRQAPGGSGMPDVSIQIEQGGFYLLDNNATLADLVLGELVRYLLGYYGSVTIEEP